MTPSRCLHPHAFLPRIPKHYGDTLKGVAFRDELQVEVKRLETEKMFGPPNCPSCTEYNRQFTAIREALSCSSKNCSELGRFHDGDCSDCPQGMIRARVGLSAPSVFGLSVADSDSIKGADK